MTLRQKSFTTRVSTRELPEELIQTMKILNTRASILNKIMIINEDEEDSTISEVEYYVLFEAYLESLHEIKDNNNSITEKKETTKSTTTTTMKFKLPSDLNSKLIEFHVTRVMCGGWIFDHDMHAKYSYYPSNAYPLGSSMEYMYFIRPWSKNVNNLYVSRMYKRYPNFNHLLDGFVSCPCMFMYSFNVLYENEYIYRSSDDATDKSICKIAIENELMMRSEFFLKREFRNFNCWFYSNIMMIANFVSPTPYLPTAYLTTTTDNDFNFTIHTDRKCFDEQPPPVILDIIHSRISVQSSKWFQYLIYQQRLEKRSTTSTTTNNEKTTVCYNATTKAPATAAGQLKKRNNLKKKNNLIKEERVQIMRSILENLYFSTERNHYTYDSGDCLKNPGITTLVRCEDYHSGLYSPVLKATGCKHSDENVYFIQKRSGDEIATEVRKCRECGNVRTL